MGGGSLQKGGGEAENGRGVSAGGKRQFPTSLLLTLPKRPLPPPPPYLHDLAKLAVIHHDLLDRPLASPLLLSPPPTLTI